MILSLQKVEFFFNAFQCVNYGELERTLRWWPLYVVDAEYGISPVVTKYWKSSRVFVKKHESERLKITLEMRFYVALKV